MGKIPHILFSAFICFFTFHLASFLLREFSEFIIQNYLPFTPNWVIVSIMGICIIYAVRSGVGTIFQFAQFTFFIVLAVFLLIPILLGNELKMEMFRSVALFTHHSFRDIWNASIFMTPVFGESFIVMLIYPHLERSQNTFKTIQWSVILTGAVILSQLLPVIPY